MNSREQAASSLLHSISESLDPDPDNVAQVAGQFITPHGNLEASLWFLPVSC